MRNLYTFSFLNNSVCYWLVSRVTSFRGLSFWDLFSGKKWRFVITHRKFKYCCRCTLYNVTVQILPVPQTVQWWANRMHKLLLYWVYISLLFLLRAKNFTCGSSSFLRNLYKYVPSKATTLVNLIITDLLSYFSSELWAWSDTSLKTVTKHLCLWLPSCASDKYYCFHLLSDWTGLGRLWNDGMEKICHLYRMFVPFQSVTFPKIWVEHPSNTPPY